jgi:uroporphyrinogen decarboxylase
MNSRERIMAAINHMPTDRPAIDFGGHRSSGIMAVTYAKLKEALGIKTGHIYVYDMIQQLAIVEPEVLDALNVDTVELGRAFMLSDGDWKDWILPDGTPCKIPTFIEMENVDGDQYLLAGDGTRLGVQVKDSFFFEQCHFPMADVDFENDSFDDLTEQFAYTQWTGIAAPGSHLAMDEAGLAELAEGAKRLRGETDRAIIGLFGGNLFEIPQYLIGMEKYLLYLGLYPDAIKRFSQKLTDLHLANLEKWLGAVGPYIDIVLFGDDLGTQTGPFMSTQMYRDYFKPYHSQLWHRAKELADVKVQLHCCGGVEPLLNDLIEAGLDAINPVQISCDGMDSQLLKDKYHDRLCLWGGGCDTREILPLGNPEDVSKHVKEQLTILNPGGGFVFQQVHNILAGVPVENIIAMFDAIVPIKRP